MSRELMESVTIGPFPVFFTNLNTEMGLKGHSHTGHVSVTYLTVDSTGFPSFHDTNGAVELRLQELTSRAFRDCTNEEVARRLFQGLEYWTSPEIERWQSAAFVLLGIELAVQGVRDTIGHAASVTRYRVQRTPEAACSAWSFRRPS